MSDERRITVTIIVEGAAPRTLGWEVSSTPIRSAPECTHQELEKVIRESVEWCMREVMKQHEQAHL